MEKVIVNLFVPCLEERFDIYIPVFLTVQEIVSLISSMLAELTNQRFVPSGQEVLCSADKNRILGQTNTLKEYGVENGECLILF